MPSSSLASYLAKNYLTADTSSEKKSKKRKRTTAASNGTNGLSIADDDLDTWTPPTTSNGREEDDGPLTLSSGRSAEFRKKKTSQWQTLDGAPASFANEDAAAADQILANAAAENEARSAREREAADDAPAIVGDVEGEAAQVMSNGAHAGLQSAADMAVQMARHRQREAATDKKEHGTGQGETIYRDASGRIVNIAMKRAEARAKAAEAEEKKRKAEETNRGDVQRAQKEERKQALEDAKLMPFARGVEDEDMNAELRERDVWGDPMAGQLEGIGAKSGKNKDDGKIVARVKKSITGRPLYAGAAPPNRYGIRPGHKWDGVDRGIGFESDWFKARNVKKDRAALEWNWQMDE